MDEKSEKPQREEVGVARGSKHQEHHQRSQSSTCFARSPEEEFGKASGELRIRPEMRDQGSLAQGAVKVAGWEWD